MPSSIRSTSGSRRRHVVIVGGGFGGLQTARHLKRANVSVTLVDRHNYHLFQPLLYQVATGGLSPANIAAPLRYILRRQSNCEVLLAEVVDIDFDQQQVVFADGRLDYDDLVIATGATHHYFGNDQWRPYAPGLKTIEDAIEIRRRIFLAFEAAERISDPSARQSLMTFVVVGGGPTGVELAGSLAEIARHTLKHDFRHINPEDARIVMIEAAESVLGSFAPDLRKCAAEKICKLGIEVRTQTKVTEITATQVHIATPDGTDVIVARTVLWAAGVRAHPLGKVIASGCRVELDRAGRVPVSPNLTVSDRPNLFVIGDLAHCQDESGQPLPGLAPVAMQQGAYVARTIANRAEGTILSTPFKYRDRGTMATIGRAAAVAEVGTRHFCGFFAWLLWLLVHLMQIVLFQNRILILIQWAWMYLTFNRPARIITGEGPVIIVESQTAKDDSVTRGPALPSNTDPQA